MRLKSLGRWVVVGVALACAFGTVFAEAPAADGRGKIEVRGRALVDGRPTSATVGWMREDLRFIVDVKTDDGGNFVVRLPQAGRYSAVVLATGGGGFERQIDVPEKGLSALELAAPTGAVVGVVVGPGGAPLADVYVAAKRADRRRSGGGAFSGPDGRFRICAVEPGAYRLVASKEGLASVVVPPIEVGATDATAPPIALDEGRTLALRFVDPSGAAVEPVHVGVCSEEGDDLHQSATRRADGAWVLRAKSDVRLRVCEQKAGGAVLAVRLEGGATRTIALPAPGAIRIRFVARDGKDAIVGADGAGDPVFTAFPSACGMAGNRKLGGPVASGGERLVQPLAPGRYLVRAVRTEVLASREVVVRSGETTTVELRAD